MTPGVSRNDRWSTRPLVGLNPAPGSSAVMRAATQWPRGGRGTSAPQSTSGAAAAAAAAPAPPSPPAPAPSAPAPAKARTSGMRCSGTPQATSSWAAGRLTPVTASVTGCSTCSRGFTSRKLYSPLFMLYRYSTVPAPT